MESECPDPFPGLRMLPDDFELERCICCYAYMQYIGYYHRGGRRIGPFALSFHYIPELGIISRGEQMSTFMTDENCAFYNKEAMRVRPHDIQCTG